MSQGANPVARIAAARRLWAAAILAGVALIPTTTRSEETAMTSTMTPLDTPRETATDTIRPFQFHASDEDLNDTKVLSTGRIRAPSS